jgi:ABC-type Na+ efflux pump permease subunit
MNKLLAVIKREYLQRVRTKFFVVATILGPVMLLLFTVVPVYIANMNIGGATRLAVVDQSGTIAERFRETLSRHRDDDEEESKSAGAAINENRPDRMKRTAQFGEKGFAVEIIPTNNRPIEEIKR